MTPTILTICAVAGAAQGKGTILDYPTVTLGNGTALYSNGSWKTADGATYRMYPGDRVRFSADGPMKASILAPDTSIIRVNNNSEVKLVEYKGAAFFQIVRGSAMQEMNATNHLRGNASRQYGLMAGGMRALPDAAYQDSSDLKYVMSMRGIDVINGWVNIVQGNRTRVAGM